MDTPKRALSRLEVSRINDALLDAVATTKLSYEHAKAEAAKLNRIRTNLAPGHPDGAAATLKALRIQGAATTRYMEAIRELSAFALDRIIPPRFEKPE